MSGPRRMGLARRLALRLLTADATISRNDGADTYVVVATGVPCQASASRLPQEEAIAGEVRAIVRWVIRLPIGTDVRTTDRITIAGRMFEVTATVEAIDTAPLRLTQAVEIA